MRTEIATLGEFGLIDRLTEGIKLENESSKYGVGDDAAVLSYPSEKQVLVTTDLLMEGVHFDLTYVPLKHLGYKAAVVNFSDIYAMNGTPRQITVDKFTHDSCHFRLGGIGCFLDFFVRYFHDLSLYS